MELFAEDLKGGLGEPLWCGVGLLGRVGAVAWDAGAAAGGGAKGAGEEGGEVGSFGFLGEMVAETGGGVEGGVVKELLVGGVVLDGIVEG